MFDTGHIAMVVVNRPIKLSTDCLFAFKVSFGRLFRL